MQALMFFAALAVAALGQWFNAKTTVPPLAVKGVLALVGPAVYLIVKVPAAWTGPEFLAWFDEAWVWALALPGIASLIGVAPGMNTKP